MSVAGEVNAELVVALRNIIPWAAKAVAEHPHSQIIGRRALARAERALEDAEREERADREPDPDQQPGGHDWLSDKEAGI